MIVAEAHLKSTSPYSHTRYVMDWKAPQGEQMEYERTHWRDRIHRDAEGHVLMTGMCFKKCVEAAAVDLGTKIPGQGNKRFGQVIRQAVHVFEDVVLPVLAEEVEGEWLVVPLTPQKLNGPRGPKCFMVIPEWEATVRFNVLDTRITKEIFATFLRRAGQLIGLGRFRPSSSSGGTYGRFELVDLEWTDTA